MGSNVSIGQSIGQPGGQSGAESSQIYRSPELLLGGSVSTQMPSSAVRSPEMLQRAVLDSPALVFRGGKILKRPEFSNIFLGSYWNTKQGRAERTYQDNFAKSLLKSPHMGVWRQYGFERGSFKGSVVADGVKSVRRVSEDEVQRVVAAEIASGAVSRPTGQTVYTLYLPPGAILESSDGYTSQDGLGGYHGSFDQPDGTRVYYAALVYSAGNNGINFAGNSRDNITITASHEWAEAVTDPDVNAGKLGWYDDRYGEIGDIPINQGMLGKDVYGRVDGFAVQKEWSNKDHRAETTPKHGS